MNLYKHLQNKQIIFSMERTLSYSTYFKSIFPIFWGVKKENIAWNKSKNILLLKYDQK